MRVVSVAKSLERSSSVRALLALAATVRGERRVVGHLTTLLAVRTHTAMAPCRLGEMVA